MLNIKQRQMNLSFLNYSTGGIDGVEGAKTKAAYKAFQRDFGLTADGIYGPNTDNKLVQVIKDIQAKIGAGVDGVAGENTKSKCREYQSNNGLIADGICGIATRNRLNNENLSWDNIKYFKPSEFACKCKCGLNNIDLKLVKILDEIREHYNRPVIVTSGCRCSKHNKNVGGVQGSRHVLGKASDIYVQGISSTELLQYTQKLVNQGKARYTYTNNKNMNGVVHIDIV